MLLSEEEFINAVLSFDGGRVTEVTDEWVKEIGGDGYAENAMEAVNVAKKLLKVAA